MILKKHKNQLLTIIQESGFDPGLFAAEDCFMDGSEFFVVSLRDSPVSFAVHPYDGSFDSFMYRHSEFREGFPFGGYRAIGSWDPGLVEAFKRWLKGVVEPYIDDICTPDMWELLQKAGSQASAELGTPKDFEYFSDEEKLQRRMSINEFRLQIVKNFGPTDDEIKVIDDRLKYLSEALDKHNRFDWKGIAISTVIAISIALSLDTEQGAKLFQIFRQVFSGLLYLLS